MITLHYLLTNTMAWGRELEIFDDGKYDTPLISGMCNSIDLPEYLFDAEVVHINPGIVTKIFIKV